jgi:hypothetical protein
VDDLSGGGSKIHTVSKTLWTLRHVLTKLKPLGRIMRSYRLLRSNNRLIVVFEDLSTPIEPAYIYYVCGTKIMTALKFRRRDNHRNETFRTLFIWMVSIMFNLNRRALFNSVRKIFRSIHRIFCNPS